MPGSQEVLANRMPIWEDGEIVGAVAVFRDRTEVTNLAEALTGSRHLVEAMRAYAHEFITSSTPSWASFSWTGWSRRSSISWTCRRSTTSR